ncbi:MAG: hypothetical protein JXQ23_06170 [Clostridia bacterium]|nr:hypothetical protein [Clostridia bacterium]
MRKLSIVVLMILFLIGCNKSTENPFESAPEELTVNPPVPTFSALIENNERADINYAINDYLYDEIKENPILFAAYFEGKYGIKINLNYFNMKSIDYILEKKPEGIIFLSNGYNKEIYQLIDNGRLYDISRFYDKYNLRQIIDQAYITPISKNGKIYAIPAISKATILPRYYNKEYLESLGLSVPVTIEEFTNYMIEVKKTYPDTYPLYVSAANVGQSTADLFRSYKVYLNAYNGSAICYNPKTGSIEDEVFSENFEAALSYIRMLQDNKYMEIFSLQNNKLPEELALASEFNFTYFKGNTWAKRIPEYEYMTGYYLKGINKEQLVEAKRDISFYVLPAFSEKADSLMEPLNKMLTDKKYYYDMKYGMEGIDYTYISSINQVVRINDFRGISQIQQIDYSADEKLAEDIISNYQAEMVYETNSFFDLDSFSKTLTFTENKRLSYFSDSSVQVFVDLFNKDISIEDSIQAYKTEFNRQHIKTLIDSFNEKLRFTSSYEY